MRRVSRVFKPERVEVDGHWFDSTAEARRYGTLRLLTMTRGATIRNLQVHPRLPMVINGVAVGRGYMTLDFCYEEFRDGEWRLTYEDCKSVDTEASRFRRKVCEAVNGIKIKVTQT